MAFFPHNQAKMYSFSFWLMAADVVQPEFGKIFSASSFINIRKVRFQTSSEVPKSVNLRGENIP